MKMAYMVIGAIVIAVVAAAGGFFGGMTYAQSQNTSSVSDFARQRGIQGGTGGGQGAGGAQAVAGPCGFPNFAGGNRQGGGNGGTGGTNGGNANGGTGNGGTGNGGTRGQGAGGFGGQFGVNFGGLTAAQLGSCVARGQVKSVDGNTVQISTANNVITVQVNDKTYISKMDQGTIADLKTGDRVTVFSPDTGDSPTASAIQLQPASAAPQPADNAQATPTP